MSFVRLIAHNYTVFQKALIFLMKLAWKSRIRLPYLILIGFMVLDVRVTLEIVIDLDSETSDAHGNDAIESSSDSEDLED